jgi:diacylglycerol kinase family enzyme
MRVLVILNAKAGTLVSSAEKDQATRIRDRFATHGVEAEVRDVPGPELLRTTTEARNSGRYQLIVAGGGDGTLNTIAGALVGGDVPFGVLPLGTFNHLAKELAIPLELDAAVDALALGSDHPFNVGEVNGQVFLLFAAIGIYSDMIKHRDAQRAALGRKKMWAGTIAFFKMLDRWPLLRVTLRDFEPSIGRHSITRLTTVAYVSLSGFQMEQMGLADAPMRSARTALTVLVSTHLSRMGLLWVIAKGMLGRARVREDMEEIRCDALTLVPHGRSVIRVGYDGEVATMETPLKLRVIRGGLKMRVPAAAPASVVTPAAVTPGIATPGVSASDLTSAAAPRA